MPEDLARIEKEMEAIIKAVCPLKGLNSQADALDMFKKLARPIRSN